MSSASVPAAAPVSTELQGSARTPRLWVPLLIVGIYTAAWVAAQFLELPFFIRFLLTMALPALLLLAFSIWWLSRRWIALSDRLLGYALVVGGAIPAALLSHPSSGIPNALMFGLPITITLWMLWVCLLQRLYSPWRQVSNSARPNRLSRPLWVASILLVSIAWGSQTLLRMEGLDGDLHGNIKWRWAPTAEEEFLKSKPAQVASTASIGNTTQLELQDSDWPGFRGASRDGVVRSSTIATDWKASSPKLLWKQRIGPAWSSMAVIGDHLFTQEQRGEEEAVVCYDATTGKELWLHTDKARFYEPVSGPGPRATPTFSNGRLYAYGATGILNCLDAVSGRKLWTQDLQKVASAKPPMWGFSSSPLVVDGLVVVFGGGAEQDNLHAFDAESGDKRWSARAGKDTYGSPAYVTLAGTPQIVILSNVGVVSVEPATGKKLWQAGTTNDGAPRSLQAQAVGDSKLIIGTLNVTGTGLIEVGQSDDQGQVTTCWDSSQMKAEFSDLVVHDGHAYGFDGAIFCCLDLATGERAWKGGRYGRGQVLLLAEQALLLVLSEKGEAVLLAAQAGKHLELAKFAALTGKTWNHPVLVRNRLFVRNAEQIACYELPAAPR